jgi:hypothetical protein
MARRTIRTDDLAAQLRLIRIGLDDYVVLAQAGLDVQLEVGRIVRIRWRRPSGKTSWFWTITGPAEPVAGIDFLGEAEDLDTAKSVFSKAF